MNLELPIWHASDGSVVSCTEKVKVMTENMEELAQMAQDAFEDAILMGCDEQQVRSFLVSLMQRLENPYQG
ncbi:hypothetical protein ACFPAG_06560 [Vogesella sp. GCM10023246]|uniref:Transcriptional regulator n=1 Tax=Vogesella oryzagri TaxID=3160864 RepID=A0ABV1M206_9NEIS